MALPTSGELSINDIRLELGASATNQSLGAFSDTAGFAAPDAITDFYGYSNSTLKPFYATSNSYKFEADACDVATPLSLWHDGSASYPAQNDTIYTDVNGSTTAQWARTKGININVGANSILGLEINFSGVVNSPPSLCF